MKKPRVILEEPVVRPVEPVVEQVEQIVRRSPSPQPPSPRTLLRNAHSIIMNHRRSQHEARRSHWEEQIAKSLRVR